ncbi:MAG TPA: hypothetical protein EYN46_01145 [Candidatus Poseidoniales archaeon]|nr:hypothetical protein [Candidatus Poseidoniales archaeon]
MYYPRCGACVSEKTAYEKKEGERAFGYTMLSVGAGWFAFAYFIWQLPFFWNSMMYESVWWGLLAILLTYIAIIPFFSGLLAIFLSSSEKSGAHKEQIWVGLSLLLPSIEWLYLWMLCLPDAWGLYPYDAWWKFLIAIPLLAWATPGAIASVYMILGPGPQPPIELGSRYLEKGMKGDDVREMQALLNQHGASIGVDGSFGSQTEDALKQFQSDSELKVDGVVGKKTLAALRIDLPQSEPTLEIEPANPQPYTQFTVSFAGSSGDSHAWIGIFSLGASNGEHHGRWFYVGGSQSPGEAITEGTLTFSEGQPTGDYEVRLFGDNGLERLLISHAFTVTEPEPEPEPAQTEEPIPAKVEEPESPPSNDLKAVAKDLQTAAFSSDRKKIIEGLGDTPQSLDITIERVDRTTGIGLPDELRRGMTIYGKNTDGSELEIRMPNSMNDELKKLGKGDSLSCDAVAVSWNSMRKLIQMNWKG